MNLSNKTMLHVKNDGVEYLQFKRLLDFKNLINCYTLSANNVDFRRNFPEESTDIIEQSYNKICSALDIQKDTIVRPKQSHTDCIKIVENTCEKFEDVDGLITNKPGINLMLTFADCTPIFLYDPEKNVIGNIHSGWRGTVKRIGAKAVDKMVRDFGCNPKNIIACIGPCIQKCHFEVEEDVKSIFEQTFETLNKNYDIIEQGKIIDGRMKYYIDTTLINKLILEEHGLRPENIIESNICTVCNSKIMHSYRADGESSGRNVAILGMKY